MSKAKKILGTEEAWENGELGENLETARVAPPELKKAVDDALAMQMISIRLPKAVIDDFKTIAEFEGIGYQPLMREALMRYAECEAKRIMREVVSQRRRDAELEQSDQKKAA